MNTRADLHNRGRAPSATSDRRSCDAHAHTRHRPFFSAAGESDSECFGIEIDALKGSLGDEARMLVGIAQCRIFAHQEIVTDFSTRRKLIFPDKSRELPAPKSEKSPTRIPEEPQLSRTD